MTQGISACLKGVLTGYDLDLPVPATRIAGFVSCGMRSGAKIQ
jgi:hypothetical protein